MAPASNVPCELHSTCSAAVVRSSASATRGARLTAIAGNCWRSGAVLDDPEKGSALVLVILNVGRRLIVAFPTAEEHQPHQPESYDARKEYPEDHRDPFVRAHVPFNRVP